MERLLMPPEEFQEDVIDMDQYRDEVQRNPIENDEDGTIDMEQYSKSKEAEEATWWDVAKDVVAQPVLGALSAFTYPLDLLKLGMILEGVSGIDEVEEAHKKEGKDFNRAEYVKAIAQEAEFIPTQELLEGGLENLTGWDLTRPKSDTGKAIRKFFNIATFLRGKGATKALTGAAVGTGTTAALRAAGAPDLVSELSGDVTGLGTGVTKKTARALSPEAKELETVASKYNLPLMEALTREEVPLSAKITAGRKRALEKQLGESTESAIQGIIEERIPAAKLRKEGKDTKLLEELAYEHAAEVASKSPQEISLDPVIKAIDQEISRVKSLSPSPSNEKKAYLSVLEQEKALFKENPKYTAPQLIEQTRDYNSNVKSIYKKRERTGLEDATKDAYAFLNDRIRGAIEQGGASDVVAANKAANLLYAENAKLARTEASLMPAFQEGKYSAKRLNKVLDSKQGNILRRDLGDKAVKELKDIAEFGTKAQNATAQLAKSPAYKFDLKEWGPLAGYIFAHLPGGTAAAVAIKPMTDYVRGYLLSRPATREIYHDIIMNAAKGSFKPMTADFSRLEQEIVKDYGDMDEFFKEAMRELQFYQEGEEG